MILAMKTGYSYILQSVESDKEILDKEWNSINWNSIEYSIFKIQKRIFEAEKNGDYRKVNRLCRLLVNDKRSLLYGIYVVTKRNKGKRTSGIDGKIIKTDSERMALFYKLSGYKIAYIILNLFVGFIFLKRMVKPDLWVFQLLLIGFIKKYVS